MYSILARIFASLVDLCQWVSFRIWDHRGSLPGWVKHLDIAVIGLARVFLRRGQWCKYNGQYAIYADFRGVVYGIDRNGTTHRVL